METYEYYTRLKKKIGRIIDPSISDSPLEKWIDFVFILVISLNIIAVIVETDQNIGNKYPHYFRMFESFSIFFLLWNICLEFGP